jgi:hypothetical protein
MYYEIISKPIDLTIIRNKLDNGEYFSYDLFEQDLLLLFTNAIVCKFLLFSLLRNNRILNFLELLW